MGSDLPLAGFASVALVMIVTTRFIRILVKEWHCSSLLGRLSWVRHDSLALLSIITEVSYHHFRDASMWLIAIGIVFDGFRHGKWSAMDFGDAAGTAARDVLLHSEALIVSGLVRLVRSWC